VYRNLTGNAADPFPAFKQMLDAAFPRTAPDGTPIPSVVPGSNPDNPYPLNQYEPEVPVAARVFWQMNPGRNVVNLNWDAISADSVVMISASEYNPNSQQLPDGSDQRFVGGADVTVANVTPHGPPFDPNHGVTFVVEVGWSSPLTICTDVAVVADAPVAVVYSGPQIASRGAGNGAGIHRAFESRPLANAQLTASVSAAHSSKASAAQANGPITFHEATVTT
jgi:hypothetical protein